MTVFRGPTTLALHIAGTGRIKQNKERNVAMKLLAVFANSLRAVYTGADAECEQHLFNILTVAFIDDGHRESVPDI